MPIKKKKKKGKTKYHKNKALSAPIPTADNFTELSDFIKNAFSAPKDTWMDDLLLIVKGRIEYNKHLLANTKRLSKIIKELDGKISDDIIDEHKAYIQDILAGIDFEHADLLDKMDWNEVVRIYLTAYLSLENSIPHDLLALESLHIALETNDFSNIFSEFILYALKEITSDRFNAHVINMEIRCYHGRDHPFIKTHRGNYSIRVLSRSGKIVYQLTSNSGRIILQYEDMFVKESLPSLIINKVFTTQIAEVTEYTYMLNILARHIPIVASCLDFFNFNELENLFENNHDSSQTKSSIFLNLPVRITSYPILKEDSNPDQEKLKLYFTLNKKHFSDIMNKIEKALDTAISLALKSLGEINKLNRDIIPAEFIEEFKALLEDINNAYSTRCNAKKIIASLNELTSSEYKDRPLQKKYKHHLDNLTFAIDDKDTKEETKEDIRYFRKLILSGLGNSLSSEVFSTLFNNYLYAINLSSLSKELENRSRIFFTKYTEFLEKAEVCAREEDKIKADKEKSHVLKEDIEHNIDKDESASAGAGAGAGTGVKRLDDTPISTPLSAKSTIKKHPCPVTPLKKSGDLVRNKGRLIDSLEDVFSAGKRLRFSVLITLLKRANKLFNAGRLIPVGRSINWLHMPVNPKKSVG